MRNPTLLVLVAVSALLIYVLLDGGLTPLAKTYAEASDHYDKAPSRAYRIALGMHASLEDDAYEIGSKTILDKMLGEEVPSIVENVSYPEYPHNRQLSVPTKDESELYCRFRELGCPDRILANSHGRTAELQRLRILVDRYDDYLAAGDYRTEIVPDLTGPVPNYRYLLAAQRMKLFAAIHFAENGDEAKAVDDLLEDLRLLRELLASSDEVLHKGVTAAMIRNQLDSVAFVHATFEAPFVLPVAPLTSEEMDFGMVLQTEFGIVYRLATYLDGHPNLLSQELEMPVWLSDLAFPSSKVINSAAKQAEAQINLSRMSPPEFAESVGRVLDDRRSFFSFIPSVNELMIDMADIDFQEFVAQAFDLNVKIELVNAQITGGSSTIVNPYYPDADVVLRSNQDDDSDMRFCLDGPLPDNRGGRCLNVYGAHEQMISLIE